MDLIIWGIAVFLISHAAGFQEISINENAPLSNNFKQSFIAFYLPDRSKNAVSAEPKRISFASRRFCRRSKKKENRKNYFYSMFRFFSRFFVKPNMFCLISRVYVYCRRLLRTEFVCGFNGVTKFNSWTIDGRAGNFWPLSSSFSI